MDNKIQKDYVQRSFKRCAKHGVDKEIIYSKKIIENDELQELLNKKSDLILAAEPFISELFNIVRGTNFFAILTDENGCILILVGDEDILKEANDLKMIPGAYMDEKNIGTNAMGTVLEEKFPLQISGKEHFINAYHKWTCSASTIKDTYGEIIGTLDLTSYTENVHLHTLGMVVASVKAIESNLKFKKKSEALKSSVTFAKTLIDSIQTGIVSCDLNGNIISVNKQAYQMSGYSKEEKDDINIKDIFDCWDAIKNDCLNKKEFKENDVLVNFKSNKLYFNLDAYPVVDDKNNVFAIILLFKDLKRLRKHANGIMGRKAIYTFDKIVGKSKKLHEVIEFAKKVASSKSTVLLTGESGTGKEIFAHSIHNYSSRKNENFVVVNCASIPKNLIESELFGYVEGAFTGAKKSGQIGKFEIADGGTIFLDEIGDLPLDMQSRLLRVIQDGIVTRVGGNNQIPVDVRIVAASNKNLKEEVEKGKFRMDLFYRLNVLPINLPPLRERKEDIPILVDYFVKKITKKINKKPVNISKEYMSILVNYKWPGNIRELENLVELMINTEKMPTRLIEDSSTLKDIKNEDVILTIEELESAYVKEILKRLNNNVTLTAKVLGVGRNTIYRKME